MHFTAAAGWKEILGSTTYHHQSILWDDDSLEFSSAKRDFAVKPTWVCSSAVCFVGRYNHQILGSFVAVAFESTPFMRGEMGLLISCVVDTQSLFWSWGVNKDVLILRLLLRFSFYVFSFPWNGLWSWNDPIRLMERNNKDNRAAILLRKSHFGIKRQGYYVHSDLDTVGHLSSTFKS